MFNKATKTGFVSEYEIKDNLAYIKVIKKKKTYITTVDLKTLDYLIKINRTLSIDCRGYIFISQEDTQRQLFIHNLVIFGLDYYTLNMDILVDHKNGDILNNTEENLRIADNFDNTQNARRRKDNTCGIKGFTIRSRDDRPTKGITVRIQSHKDRIGKSFILSKEGLEQAIIWDYNARKEMHGEFMNYGFNANDKTLAEIVKEQSKIFISNLNESDLKIFNKDGYSYEPKKFKPYKEVNILIK